MQLREKDLSGRELFLLAEKAKALCAKYGAALFINDRIDVALAVDADGVQLASSSVPVHAARELFGEKKFIGVSTHALKEAQAAARESANFILFGPVYFTPSKAAYGAPQGLQLLREITQNVSCPVYAIGGINAGNVSAVKETGVHGVALISAVLSAADPRQAAEELTKLAQVF